MGNTRLRFLHFLEIEKEVPYSTPLYVPLILHMAVNPRRRGVLASVHHGGGGLAADRLRRSREDLRLTPMTYTQKWISKVLLHLKNLSNRRPKQRIHFASRRTAMHKCVVSLHLTHLLSLSLSLSQAERAGGPSSPPGGAPSPARAPLAVAALQPSSLDGTRSASTAARRGGQRARPRRRRGGARRIMGGGARRGGRRTTFGGKGGESNDSEVGSTGREADGDEGLD
jgi:hypothetical protein